MDGKTHAATSAVLAGPTGLAVGALTHDPLIGALTAAGCLVGIPVSPDLDQDGMTISEGVVYGHFGALPGLINAIAQPPNPAPTSRAPWTSGHARAASVITSSSAHDTS